ncbi:hypothetical protein AAVH_25837 [Aphelenchoides avenae]|nr:hypothetical protein AAVH_25837 [Aphelenchus avenae]
MNNIFRVATALNAGQNAAQLVSTSPCISQLDLPAHTAGRHGIAQEDLQFVHFWHANARLMGHGPSMNASSSTIDEYYLRED